MSLQISDTSRARLPRTGQTVARDAIPAQPGDGPVSARRATATRRPGRRPAARAAQRPQEATDVRAWVFPEAVLTQRARP